MKTLEESVVIAMDGSDLVFDLNDILWTFIGSLIFIIIYKITNDKQKTSANSGLESVG